MSKPLSNDILAAYILKYGKDKAPSVIRWLAKEEGFIDAISSPQGQEIMSIHIDAADEAFIRYHEALSTSTDMSNLNIQTIMAHAEYQVSLKIIKKVSARIATFKKRQI